MAFENPTGYWVYCGTYSVELTPDASRDSIPTGAVLDGDTVRVRNGRAMRVLAGVRLYDANEQRFFWPYSSIKAIRDRDGNLLWQNRKYRQDSVAEQANYYRQYATMLRRFFIFRRVTYSETRKIAQTTSKDRWRKNSSENWFRVFHKSVYK